MKIFHDKNRNGSQANRNSLFLLKNSPKKSLTDAYRIFMPLYGINASEFKVSSLRAIHDIFVNYPRMA